jgi:hypothetical protein
MSYIGLDPRQQLLNASTQYFSGNAAATQFTLARNVASESDLDVLIGNVAQRPGIDYTAGNVTLLFSAPPASGTNNITVTFRGGALNSLDLSASVFEAGTVGAPSVVSVAANNTGFYWANATTLVATVAGANRATFNGTAASTSNVTGALTVTGGIGATGNINTSGLIRTTDATESANIGTGALVVGGGAGITGNLNVGGDITCVGDFTVNGTFTTTGTDSLEVNDPFIFLANANPGDSFDIGVLGQYNDGTDRYTGIFRDITDGAYKLFSNLTVRPTTVVDTADASFVLANIQLGTVSAAGNVTGNFFIGNGSQLTGLITTVSEIVNGDSKVEIPSINGAITANVNGVTKANITAAGLDVTGNISATLLISAAGNVIGGNISTAGVITATGNVTSAANISAGNISTGGLITAINTITGGNIATTGTASAAGNVTGGNLVTAGQVTADANITGGNVRTAGLISAAGDVYGLGGLFTTLSATGNVTGGNVISGGIASIAGTITGGNLATAGTVSAGGNVTGGNIVTAGVITATGNVTGGNIITSGVIDLGSNSTIYTNPGGGNAVVLEDDNAVILSIAQETNSLSLDADGNLKIYIQDASGTPVNVLFNVLANGVTQTNTNIESTGNVTGGNVNTGGLITATGNVSGGNINSTGLVSATANVVGGNVITGGLITATGNITGGNIATAGLITATGAIQSTSNVVGGNINTVGVVSVGGSVSVTGNVTGGNINTGGLISTTGNVTSAANVAGGNVLATGNVNTAQISATGNIVALANVTANLFLGSQLSLSGNVVSQLSITSNVTAGNLRSAGIVSATGNIIGGNVSGTRGAFTNIAGTLETAAQTNITAVGTVVSLSSTGNVTGGNINTAGLVSATGTVTGSGFVGSGATLTNLNMANAASGTLAVARGGTGVTTSTGTGAVVLGTSPTFTTQITVPAIVKSGTNGVGNIGQSGNSFNTIFAKATSAQYADLAEMYVADADYAPGTVVSFGGTQEITLSREAEDARVAGVVSTNPSYLMNATQAGEHVVAVALTGRVPTRVVGAVRKGDLMVSAGDGAARSQSEPRTGSVIGKALQDHDGSTGMIEIVVGRL